MRAFFLHPESWKAPFILHGQEARHIARTLRLRPGEHILLLDGQGRYGEFSLLSVKAEAVKLEPLNLRQAPAPNGRAFLAAAYTKAARRSFLLEKAVELNAGGLWFWQAEHSQTALPDLPREHWQAQLIAGAKQSLNPWLPELRMLPGGAGEVAARGKSFARRFLLWEEALHQDMLNFAQLAPGPENENTLFVMGPEGGLSRTEADLFLAQGFTPVSLGRRVLRWETAAVLCLGLCWWAGECTDTACDTMDIQV